MLTLTVQPATPTLVNKPDGTGYELRIPSGGHHCHLQIGNVSIAFDDRNNYDACSGVAINFSEDTDCSVWLDGDDCPRCDDVAKTIMFALATDLGYTISK